MDLENFKPEWIRELNEVGKQLQNVTVKIPSMDEQQNPSFEVNATVF